MPWFDNKKIPNPILFEEDDSCIITVYQINSKKRVKKIFGSHGWEYKNGMRERIEGNTKTSIVQSSGVFTVSIFESKE